MHGSSGKVTHDGQVTRISVDEPYPKQVLIAPRHSSVDAKWQTISLTDGMEAHVDPALPHTVRRTRERTVALFGEAVDPRDPNASNAEVAARIVEQCDSKTRVLAESAWLGGSWVLFYDDAQDRVVFSDALGTKSIHYWADGETVMCATDPDLLARLNGLPVDPEAQLYEVKEKERTKEKRVWWPNDVSLYSGVKRLLPNHYLDMARAKSVRYWPLRTLQRKPEHEVVSQLASLMRGALAGLYERYRKKLAIVLTAGMDSRILLAAAKPFAKDLYYFVYVMLGMDVNHEDIIIPGQLARKLGLRFDPVSVGQPLPGRCEVVLRGGGGGIGRSIYVRSAFQQLNPELLAGIAGVSGNAFALKHFGQWLSNAEPIGQECDINVMDLFLWEQRLGSWGADSALLSDRRFPYRIVRPFSCRLYAEEALASPYRRCSRHAHNYKLLLNVIKDMWPEVLSEPINPGTLWRNRFQTLKRHLIFAR